jgi:cobalt-zinc-cadmium efflux system outer membrane protein
MRPGLVILTAALASGCGTLPEAERARAVDAIAERAGARPHWPSNDREEADRRAAVATLLAEPLTPEAASAVALAGHARVTAILESLGVAQADYLAEVLPRPPMLGAIRLEGDNGDEPKLSHHAGLDLLGLLTLPAKLPAARGEREAARALAVRDVLVLAGAARSMVIRYVAARQVESLLIQAADAADAAADSADALFEAGNIAQVDRDRERLFAEEIQLQADRARARTLLHREAVNAALGLKASPAETWTSIPRLPVPPPGASDLSDLETRALAASLDLAASLGALAAARARSDAGWLTSLAPGLELEGEREREDGAWKSGLGLSVLAPIFDLGGGARLRLGSATRQRAALADAMEAELRAETRARAIASEAARTAALRRRDVMLPLADAVFEGARLDYNAMEIDLIQLLQARRQRIDAGVAAVEAVRDYWLAKADLDLLLAGASTGGSAIDGGEAKPPGRAEPGH